MARAIVMALVLWSTAARADVAGHDPAAEDTTGAGAESVLAFALVLVPLIRGLRDREPIVE